MTNDTPGNGRLTIDAVGTRFWYHNILFHRLDGPAIEFTHGTKWWFVNGKRHNLSGPAIVTTLRFAIEPYSWFIDDVNYTEDEFNAHPMVVMHRFVNRLL